LSGSLQSWSPWELGLLRAGLIASGVLLAPPPAAADANAPLEMARCGGGDAVTIEVVLDAAGETGALRAALPL
jgi:hypothetical protein